MPSSACKTCALDRKSTRLNSSHTIISYALFCLKKQKQERPTDQPETPGTAGQDRGLRRAHALPPRHRRRESHTSTPGAATLPWFCFFFNETAPPAIYPLPLHDALPI